MAEFKNLRKDYRGFEVVDVYEGDRHLCTISLHEEVITVQVGPAGSMLKTFISNDFPQSVVLKFQHVRDTGEHK